MYIQWDIKAIKGAHRWLKRIWSLSQEHIAACDSRSGRVCRVDRTSLEKKLVSVQHKTIKQVMVFLSFVFSMT